MILIDVWDLHSEDLLECPLSLPEGGPSHQLPLMPDHLEDANPSHLPTAIPTVAPPLLLDLQTQPVPPPWVPDHSPLNLQTLCSHHQRQPTRNMQCHPILSQLPLHHP